MHAQPSAKKRLYADIHIHIHTAGIYKRRLALEDNWIIDPAPFPESDVRKKTSIGAATDSSARSLAIFLFGKYITEGRMNCRIVGFSFSFFFFYLIE